MRLPESERAFNRAAFRAMSISEKADYIFSYYKLPIVLILIAVIAVGSAVHKAVTSKKAVLYVGYCNVVPAGAADAALTSGYLEHVGADSADNEVACYRELYVSTDDSLQNHQYAYASKLKLLASIDGEQLDAVLMNQEAYDLLSGWGYLIDLEDALAQNGGADAELAAAMVSNTVILSDNRVEVELGEADAYVAETIEVPNAIDVSEVALFEGFSEDEHIYLGIIANTPRMEQALDYLAYVLGASA